MCTKDNDHLTSESKQMKRESAAMHRRNRLVSAAFTALILLLLCSFAAGSAVAGEITVTAPSSPVAAGETITLPVVMTGAEDIAGFEFEIANNVPGVTITINESRSSGVSSPISNSKPENAVQKIVWFSSSGVTGESVELFSLDVVVSSSDAASVPIVITPVTIVNSSSGFLTEQYPVTSAEIQLTDTAVGKVTTGSGESQASQTPSTQTTPTQTTPTQTTPTQTPPTQTPPTRTTPAGEVPGADQSTPQSTGANPEMPQVQQIVQVNTTTVTTSPLGILPLIGLAAAAFLIGRKERRP